MKSQIKELEQKLKSAKGKERINLLNDLAVKLYRYDPTKTEDYAKEALNLSKELEFEEGIAKSYRILGISYHIKGDYEQALKQYMKAAKSFEANGNKYELAHTYNNIGVVYRNQSNYDKGLEYYFKATKLYSELDDNEGIANTYNNIGVIFSEQENYEQALGYYLMSLEMRKELGNKEGISECNNNIGIVYFKLGKNDLALKYYHETLEICQELGCDKDRASAYLNIGLIYWKQDKYKLALEYLFKSLEIDEKMGNKRSIMISCIDIGLISISLGEYETSLAYLQRALALAKEIGTKTYESECYNALFMLYEAQSDFEKALYYHKKYTTLKDEIFSIEKSKYIAEMQAKYETEKMEKEISRRKAVEEALRESEEKLNKMSLAANDAIIMMDDNGNVIFWNKAAEKTFGYTKGEILGKHLHSIIAAPQYRAACEKGFAKFKRTGKGAAIGKTLELSGIRKNGEEFPLELSLSSVKIKGKWNAIGIIRDITKRKQEEEKLRKLSRAVEQSSNTIVITDTDGKIEYVNPAFSLVTGYTFEEAIGQNPRILKSGKHPPEFYEEMWDTLTKGRVWKGELINKKKNGEFYWERAVISPVMDKDCRITHYLAVKEDVTRRKEAEEALKRSEQRLREANATKDKFFSIIAHDIKNPLSVNMITNELLLSSFEDLETEQIKGFIKSIKHSSEHLFKLLENLLTWARAQTGAISYEPMPMDLQLIIEGNITLLTSSALSKNIKLNSLVKEGMWVFVDMNMLTTVIRNLLSNAIKFTKEGGEITITAEKRSDFIEVAISDTGVGISEKKLGRLFKVGEKNISTKGTANEKGTGLGLILCKEFIEKHGGKIWVESEERIGTTFSFTLKKAEV